MLSHVFNIVCLTFIFLDMLFLCIYQLLGRAFVSTMGDSEFVVAQISAVAGYSSIDNHDPNETTSAPDADASIVQTTENMNVPDNLPYTEGILDSSIPPDEANLVAHGSNVDVGNAKPTASKISEQEVVNLMAFHAN